MDEQEMRELAKELLPCPICGGEEGYYLSEGSTYRWWVLNCAECGTVIDECASDRRMIMGGELPKRWLDADDAWNANAAHANTLRLEVIKQSEKIAQLELANKTMRDLIATLYPGLVLDLRYADIENDDLDALQSRIETVQQALATEPSQAALDAYVDERFEAVGGVFYMPNNNYPKATFSTTALKEGDILFVKKGK